MKRKWITVKMTTGMARELARAGAAGLYQMGWIYHCDPEARFLASERAQVERAITKIRCALDVEGE